MRTLAFSLGTAPGTRKWVVERATVLIGANCSAGGVVISEDPALTFATFTAVVDKNTTNVYCFLSAGAAMSGILPQLNIPLEAGREVFLANSNACVCCVYLEDIS